MTSHKIRINTAPKEDLQKLYGIGPELAERIILYRESKGCFTGIEDLVKVEGIAMKLAETLSPQIDWQVPARPPRPKQVEWDKVRGGILVIAIDLYLISRVLPYLIDPSRQTTLSQGTRIIFGIFLFSLVVG